MDQGYGLSEASPIISSNTHNKRKMGSSGFLVKPMDLKICDDKGNELPLGEKGEIVIRGENVMAGYWNNPIATTDTIKDNWLYTGDMGSMDADGFLYVFGRFKSLLIADDGEKYSPEGIEEAFVGQSSFIEQCMLYNNQNPYTIALIYPNKEAIKRWLLKENLAGDTEEGQIAILKMLEGEINEYRVGRTHEKLFPQRWLPAAIGILPEGFTEDNHLMNSTMKIVRPKIIEQYKYLIDYLYTPEAKDICNTKNLDVIVGMGFNGSN
jgi:long-chain acyl-CoA synthetase